MNIKQLREAAGLSQAQVAKHLGHSTPQFISNADRGISFFPKYDFKKIAKLYRVDINTIIDLYAEREQMKLTKKINKLRKMK